MFHPVTLKHRVHNYIKHYYKTTQFDARIAGEKKVKEKFIKIKISHNIVKFRKRRTKIDKVNVLENNLIRNKYCKY